MTTRRHDKGYMFDLIPKQWLKHFGLVDGEHMWAFSIVAVPILGCQFGSTMCCQCCFLCFVLLYIIFLYFVYVYVWCIGVHVLWEYAPVLGFQSFPLHLRRKVPSQLHIAFQRQRPWNCRHGRTEYGTAGRGVCCFCYFFLGAKMGSTFDFCHHLHSQNFKRSVSWVLLWSYWGSTPQPKGQLI